MQDLARRAAKIFLLFPAWIRLKSLKWAFRLAQESFSGPELDGLSVKNGMLVHNATGLSLNDEAYGIIKGGLRYWKSFAAYPGVEKFSIEHGELVTIIDGIRFCIDHSGSLFVLDEIFAERLYDLRVNEQLVAVDIGMNIGAASLYLAAHPGITHVYSYEPLASTYGQAQANFKRNPILLPKISARQKGVSNYHGSIEVPVASAGSAVFSTDKDFINTLGTASGNTIAIDIIPVSEILAEVRDKHPGQRLFLKLDCEGEEYKIMEAIAAAGALDMISVIALEWHFKGYQSLCDLLSQNGFSVFNLGRKEIEPPCGMIYAFNMKNKTHA